jgi:hypothetical protein
MNSKFYVIRAVSSVPVFAGMAYGQGCIVARSSAQLGGPGTDGGYIGRGECSITIGYRHQFSQRHFVGDTEQSQRMALGTQVMNKINLENVNFTYQATPRFSFTVSAPILSASRRSNNSPYTLDSHGIGDVIITANGWLWDPTENTKGNVQFGLGTMLPTGASDLVQYVDKQDGKGLVPQVVDYSIQPGTGGYGLVMQWQSYRNLTGKTQLFFNGSYIATPQNTNNTLRTTSKPNPLTAYNSISDQYLLEAGVARAFSRIRGLNVFVGPRWEGVPAQDLIGDNLGFRRPGYALSIAPGFQYTWGKSIISASVGKAILRDRTRSIPDRITGGHGDAAFADYVWLASYTFRFNTRGGSSAHHHEDMPDHDAAHDAAAEHEAMH